MEYIFKHRIIYSLRPLRALPTGRQVCVKQKLTGLLFVCCLLIPALTYGYTGEIIASYDLPGSYPTGLTWDGKFIWLSDRMADKIFCIDPATGKVVRSIPSPAYWPTGLAWDGTNLWNADIKGGIPLAENYNGKIYKLNPENGNIISTVQAPSSTPRGLAWDGKYLWCVDNAADEVIRFSPDDGTTISSLKAPASDPIALAFDGTYLWIGDMMKNEIYMMDPESGSVLIIADAPGPYITGLCYDGKNLWAVDSQNDKLYKLKVRDDDKYRKTNEHKAKVTYTYLGTNFGPGKVNSLDVHFAIPQNRVNQTITSEIKYSPAYTDIVTDKWGQRTAHFHAENIEQGGTRQMEMVTGFTSWDVRYFIYPEKVGTFAQIPEDIRKKYLENNEKFQYDDPVIQNAVAEAICKENSPYWAARKIYDYLLSHMEYEMTGGWNTAPTVLARGTGSCSEYSFVYIAMCRAAGIPARYVGSVVMRGDEAAMDDVFHRWVEIYLPGYEWIPVDPSGGDDASPRDQADSFGNLLNRFLITTESGGGSETMQWTYNSNDFWTTEPKTNFVSEYFADWEPVK